MTIQTVLRRAEDFLTANGIDDARLDAEVLLAYVLRMRRLYLYVHLDLELDDDDINAYKNLVRRRVSHVPVAQLIGVKEFMGLEFDVTLDVLVPRPETELLVQTAVKLLGSRQKPSTIADIGTGSGAIAVSILHCLDYINAVAVDISPAAIDVARANAVKFDVDDRINFYVGNLLEPLSDQKFDAIISNPPYIPTAVIDELQPEVAQHEPRIALDGGADGLDCYKKIIGGAAQLLNDDGFIALEIGIDQAHAVKNLLDDTVQFGAVDIIRDLSGIERIVLAHKNEYTTDKDFERRRPRPRQGRQSDTKRQARRFPYRNRLRTRRQRA